MKLFECGVCGNTIYFENVRCEHCGHSLGYLAEGNRMLALEPDGEVFTIAAFGGERYAYCANAQHDACNWLLPHSEAGGLCVACSHNETIPALDDPENLRLWQVVERAKKRLFYSLLRLGLPLSRSANPLRFRFLANDASDGSAVMTGHDNGTITIALAEADDAEREKRRTSMGEPYRTLLGHFRHEVGHFYWDELVLRDSSQLARFRALFGDERADYGEALKRHYAQGAPQGWEVEHISAYATSHPWEDFAETWAHYLHMVDAVETGLAFNVGLKLHANDGITSVDNGFDPYRAADIKTVIDNWVPLTLLMNDLNRAIGQSDAYAFVISPVVQEKLGFIHSLVSGTRTLAAC